ncbi:MAG: hypothetical protein K8R23_15400 [Chthoniobacter sp.]|nr:hypothetical protein [Chthoniobacter sp.]
MPKPRSSSFALPPLRSILLVAALLFGLGLALRAEPAKSLLPSVGNEGADFTAKAQEGHIVKGWLPKGWKDDSAWAPLSATYTKLADSPDPASGAVRIKVEKLDDDHLQLTTFQGNRKYKKGTRYLVTGWVRNPDGLGVKAAMREEGEPYEFFHELELPATKEWKRFEFAFTPETDFEGFLMFLVSATGSVDLAGVVLEAK